jgi:hypothetical protein
MKLRRSIIVKKISMLIAVVSVFGAMAQSALAQNLVAFNGGIGDITTGSTDTTVLRRNHSSYMLEKGVRS